MDVNEGDPRLPFIEIVISVIGKMFVRRLARIGVYITDRAPNPLLIFSFKLSEGVLARLPSTGLPLCF